LLQITRTAVAELNRVSKSDYSFDEMTDGAKNIQAGSAYLQMRIDRAGSLSKGLDGYGTGKGYSTSIISAADALSANPPDPMEILKEIIGP
jgi:hypothetical protein